MTRLKYCHIQGKVRFPTFYAAYRVLMAMNHKSHKNGGSCYRCQFCHSWHITHYDEPLKPEDMIFLKRRRTKKQRRSIRNRSKRLWYPAIPLRIEIRSIKEPFNNNPYTMNQEEKIRIWESEPVRMARFKMEICYIMADVMNTFMTDAESIMARNIIAFRGEEKQKWKYLCTQAKQLKAASKQVARFLYEVPLVDEACEESDLFADLILTIAQRVNDMDRLHMEQTYKLMKATIVKNFKNLYIEHKTNI